MSEDISKSSDDDLEDHLWDEFQNCATSTTLLYKNPSWQSLQKAATATTKLYKSGLDLKKRGFEKGYLSGRQSLARELFTFRRARELSVDDIWKLISKVLAPTDNDRIPNNPQQTSTDDPAFNLFQEAVCLPLNTQSVEPDEATELTSFLSSQVHRHRKRFHSPPNFTWKKQRK
ncbi:hypothetical protein AB6A40_008204 [Gnathostoma spinigerum]|uniref:Uncharacterized protein n=1 Tax=Gnathostoma spinigerum TaxID=75299 RepID=A0ABD6EYZ5_9BILA